MNFLSKKQLTIMVFFIPLAFKMAMLPSLLYKECGADFYVGVGIITAIEFLQLFIVMKVVSLGGFAVIEERFGSLVKKLLALPLVFSMIIKTLIFATEIYYYATHFLFYNISSVPIIVTLCMAIFYLAYKGAKTIGRIFELSVWLVPLIIVFGILFGDSALCGDYLSPLFTDGVGNMLSGIDKYLIYTFDFSPLIFFRIEKGKNVPIALSSFLSVGAVIGSYVLFLASYGRASFLMPEAFARLASFNTVISEIGSLDWPSALLWLTVSVCNIAVKFCAIAETMAFFKVKRTFSLAVSVILVGVLLLFVLDSFKKVSEFVTGTIRYAVVGVEVAVPLVALVLVSLAGNKEVKYEPQS